MGKIEIELTCAFCSDKFKTEIETPQGWSVTYDSIGEDSAICPKHSAITDFKRNCSGCVGGWLNCELYQRFAYSRQRNLSEKDFEIIRSGRCPIRTNGTFMFSNKGFEDIDISERGTKESGEALEKAIKEYWEKYPE